MRWPQPHTHIQTDNYTVSGVANDTIITQRTKSMDVIFHWLRCREAQQKLSFTGPLDPTIGPNTAPSTTRKLSRIKAPLIFSHRSETVPSPSSILIKHQMQSCIFFYLNLFIEVPARVYCYHTTYTCNYPTVPRTYGRTNPKTIEIGECC